MYVILLLMLLLLLLSKNYSAHHRKGDIFFVKVDKSYYAKYFDGLRFILTDRIISDPSFLFLTDRNFLIPHF